MGDNFNIFDAGISAYAGNGGNTDVVVPSGENAGWEIFSGGDFPVSYTMPNGRTVTVDDHGNILDVHN